LVARYGTGTPRRALGASISPSRALPGHRIYRVERLGAGGSSREDVALLRAFAGVVRGDSRCLRAVVEILERESGGRAMLGETLRELGFSRVSPPRMYARTIALDLAGPEDELFASLDKTARRHVRAPAKKGLELRLIADVRYAPRIEVLLEQTFRRTEGDLQRLPWDRIIEWSVEEPRVSRVIGLFDPATEGPESLISMAWGCAQGEYACYEAGAGVRRPDLGSLPVSYAPLWDLITWARRDTGATWFDLGGASSGDADDSLAGNVEFKRYFSQQVIDVGEEWQLEPHAGRATLARAIAATARLAGRVRPWR
jgi:hypothetical protein